LGRSLHGPGPTLPLAPRRASPSRQRQRQRPAHASRKRAEDLEPADRKVDRTTSFRARLDDVLPIAMKVVPLDLQLAELLG
jgi:hypothetical protein